MKTSKRRTPRLPEIEVWALPTTNGMATWLLHGPLLELDYFTQPTKGLKITSSSEVTFSNN